MKCELCQKQDAETVLMVEKNGAEEELYVCKACANAKKRKPAAPTAAHEPPPPILEMIMNAVSDIVTEMGGHVTEIGSHVISPEPQYHEFPCGRTDPAYRIGTRFHLEGLHLIGELDAVKRALRALGMKLVGVDADGVQDAGHAYGVLYSGSTEQAKRVLRDILTQEHHARVRLREEMPKVLGDSVCRSLAILKSCRLLAEGELYDLLSPLRLAVMNDYLTGITPEAIEHLLAGVDLTSKEEILPPPERDQIDGARADEMNEFFKRVGLTRYAKEKFQ